MVPNRLLLSGVVGLAIVAVVCGQVSAAPLSVTFRGTTVLPPDVTATDQHGQMFFVHGLSGVTYLGGTTFLAVMDNSDKLVELDVRFNSDGSISGASVTGGIKVAQVHDFEGIAYTDEARHSVFLSQEDTPQVHEYSLTDGSKVQSLATPDVFANRVSNRGFESLTRRAGGSEMLTANEEALSVDGPLASPDHGTVVRLLRYDSADQLAHQFAYQVEPMHGQVVTGAERSGLVDLVVLPNGRLLTLERSLAFDPQGGPFESRLYEVDLSEAIDVSGISSDLSADPSVLVTKTLLWAGKQINQNLEGLAFGPKLDNGNHVLLGVVDDGDPLSRNTLVAFELGGDIPEPGSGALVVVMTVTFLTRRWR